VGEPLLDEADRHVFGIVAPVRGIATGAGDSRRAEDE
jgi:hypothetical protein